MTDSEPDYMGGEEYVLYRDRPHWKDVTPVEQDDGSNPVVAIAYSDIFRDVYNYFRAVLRSGEKSERVLELTNDAAQLNPANYTVWQFRRDVLHHLGSDLEEELTYIGAVIKENPKNYQVWHHRRMIVEWMNNPSKEQQFINDVLVQDSKNYHAWQHRQWVISTYKLFDTELDYVNELLEEDIRNNSAWNHRHFVISHTTGFTPEIINQELKYVMEKIRQAPSNESSWNYLRGVLIYTDSGNISSDKVVLDFCQELYESGNRSPFLLAFLVDVCEELLELGLSSNIFSPQRGLELCDELTLEYDKIRREYWKFISRRISLRMSQKADD